ncbi:MAG: hypothetical protein IPF99_38755 [Deltaproteobacteria bacterium]|nr:hypothetical protein [Deltaproteobacteria bacterium]
MTEGASGPTTRSSSGPRSPTPGAAPRRPAPGRPPRRLPPRRRRRVERRLDPPRRAQGPGHNEGLPWRWRFGLLLLLALLARAFAQQPASAGTPARRPGRRLARCVRSAAGRRPGRAATAAGRGAASSLAGGPPGASRPPAPTPEQIEALRLLEAEVDGFLQRGQGFRSSVNGLLSREHDRQLSRLRAGFDRQIQAERAAEAEARRHAIQVFERFLETYPEDTERTPDVMFRLAELYYDESAYAKLDADDVADRRRESARRRGLPTDDLPARRSTTAARSCCTAM